MGIYHLSFQSSHTCHPRFHEQYIVPNSLPSVTNMTNVVVKSIMHRYMLLRSRRRLLQSLLLLEWLHLRQGSWVCLGPQGCRLRCLGYMAGVCSVSITSLPLLLIFISSRGRCRLRFNIIWIEESLWNTAGSMGAASPCTEETAPAVVAFVEALKFAIGVKIIKWQASGWVAISRWIVGNDADWC